MIFSSNHIVYLENDYNPELHQFIRKNRKRIGKYLAKNRKVKLRFLYLPEVQERLSPEVVKYVCPYLTDGPARETTNRFLNMTTADLSGLLLKEAGYEDETFPGLFRMVKNKAGVRYQYDRIEGNTPKEWKTFFRTYIQSQHELRIENPELDKNQFFSRPAYRISESPSQKKIEDKFNKLGQKMTRKAWKQIKNIQDPEQLEMLMTMMETRLKEMDHNQRLSRIIITPDEIRLPDYQNTLIKLTPLQKSIYVLFMNHPEGLQLKDLPEYKDELEDIYMRLTRRGWVGDIKDNIDALIDPLDNSIHEKFSRIKSAFTTRFSDFLACHYYVTGARSSTKKITLDRQLVEVYI